MLLCPVFSSHRPTPCLKLKVPVHLCMCLCGRAFTCVRACMRPCVHVCAPECLCVCVCVFLVVTYWRYSQYNGIHPEAVLVGNKKDLETRRVVETEEGSELAASLNCPFVETSIVCSLYWAKYACCRLDTSCLNLFGIQNCERFELQLQPQGQSKNSTPHQSFNSLLLLISRRMRAPREISTPSSSIMKAMYTAASSIRV